MCSDNVLVLGIFIQDRHQSLCRAGVQKAVWLVDYDYVSHGSDNHIKDGEYLAYAGPTFGEAVRQVVACGRFINIPDANFFFITDRGNAHPLDQWQDPSDFIHITLV